MVSVLLIFSFLSACVSQIATIDEHVSSYIGKPISQVQELYLTPQRASIGFFESKVFAWSEEQKKFENGDTLYSYTNPYKDCVINWVADKNNIIISGSYLGDGCG
ncbi:hypothetical protein FE810_15615 [Thalassotalea litorea]|uniref:Uncharacterized protein n=1 Tax=Thalassotalea litorea TaxID=2020715 RepID=A0A5R9IET9_9GAMM|nr:hypothetical protein FE810_15615 [Thalassotalea litorea]